MHKICTFAYKGAGNIDFTQVAMGATMGGVIGGVSSAMGEWANSFIGSYFGASFNNIANIPLRETLQGAAGGLLAGSTMGALMYSFNGAKGSFWDNVLMSAAMGTIMGATSGYIKGVELQKQVRLQKNLAEAAPAPNKPLHRPYIRKNVREAVEATALRTADGKFRDANTGTPIKGNYDFGHKRGFEYWRLKSWDESKGYTQPQFNDFVNNPYFYQIESPTFNQSHNFELKGTFNIDYSKYSPF